MTLQIQNGLLCNWYLQNNVGVEVICKHHHYASDAKRIGTPICQIRRWRWGKREVCTPASWFSVKYTTCHNEGDTFLPNFPGRVKADDSSVDTSRDCRSLEASMRHFYFETMSWGNSFTGFPGADTTAERQKACNTYQRVDTRQYTEEIKYLEAGNNYKCWKRT